MTAAATIKNLAVAVVAGVAAMLIYDSIKKRAATASQPVVGSPSGPQQTFTGGIISINPGSASAVLNASMPDSARIGPTAPLIYNL
ncbi:hypothetical protein HNQ50_001433 [Silvimonas terrae]|uniref:Uncharacterized protein n=1 Tax=Silvimonas terrae TaxID=300266 RepID=A0A840REM8_9NEIS|nr:hypothetical protein [Silvimonas terrae]MBB5190711.1 hypothetical protein [Silvimonas terrae]